MKKRKNRNIKRILNSTIPLIILTPVVGYFLIEKTPEGLAAIILFHLWILVAYLQQKWEDNEINEKDVNKCLDLIIKNPERLHELSKNINRERVNTWSDDANTDHLRKKLKYKIRKEEIPVENNKILLPAKYREKFDDVVHVTRWKDHSLLLLTESEHRHLLDHFEAGDGNQDGLNRFFKAGIVEVSIKNDEIEAPFDDWLQGDERYFENTEIGVLVR